MAHSRVESKPKACRDPVGHYGEEDTTASLKLMIRVVSCQVDCGGTAVVVREGP